jgi:SAM-dependent methyltransferase
MVRSGNATGSTKTNYDEAYYAQVYPNYERQNPPAKLRFYRRLIETALPEGTRRPRVYDFGCAFGACLGSLPEGWERFGYDASEFAIESARQSHPAVVFDGEPGRLTREAGTFDAITAFDVLEHIENVDAVLAMFERALRPGGCIVAVVPVYDGVLGPLVHLLDRDPTHVHKESRRAWLDRFAQTGEIVAWTGIVRYLVPALGYLHVPAELIRSVAPAIAVTVRKRPAAS